MDEKNRNISDAFGKYNNKQGEIKDVSSADWTPISAGKSGKPGNRTSSAKNQNSSRKPSAEKKGGAKKSKTKESEDLISQGRPGENKKRAPGNSKGTSQNSRKSSQPMEPPKSRTPVGRDTRDEARKQKQQKQHNQQLRKHGEDYEKYSKYGNNHDEISQKMNADKRKKNAVKNGITIGAVLLFAAFFIGLFCYNQGALIETIIIEGNYLYTPEEIREAAGVSEGDNMLSLKEEAIKEKLTKQLPYIKDVKLNKKLPDTVVIEVVMTADKFIVTGEDYSYTLDTDGKVVSTKKQALEAGLYRVEGFDKQKVSEGDRFKPSKENEERYAIMKEIAQSFDRGGIVTSAVIELYDTKDVRVIYDDRIAIYFGDCRNLSETVPHASGIIDWVNGQKYKGEGYVDLRNGEKGFLMPGSMEIG